ncbi:GTPase activator-like protein [Angomonas deanei]|uniref:Rab-GTPase-TBC domain containing protein, putative n=1 Tax=Angomonas deanei TaxID=59799 RepID=A0A7G2CGI7_9TRYP|nr:GTPase activator-like protein [Angomonas deanei]CAD2217984.1 Rab-GTPase-TBC domain containing protein, putative [Angomonas deanei]|eukprot:EPY36250.1 GTPase activator-like protein [Angomonas deanei]
MNEFVALLLYAFSQGSTARLDRRVEADCFFCFQTLLGFLGDDFCRALDQDSDTGVHTTMRQFDNSLRLFDPEVLEHLCSLGVTSEHYALRWLLLLFIHELDLQHVLRIWDFLLSFGDELRSAAFFVAAAMCHNLRDTILASESISDVIPHLHRYPGDQMENVLRIAMRWILVCGLEIIPKIKNASEEEIGALRVKFNLDGKSPMTPNGTRKAGWFTRLFSS